MANLQNDPAYEKFDHFERLTYALEKAWTGDIEGSVSVLRDLNFEEVMRFTREGLEVEKELLDQAQQDSRASISSVTKRVQQTLSNTSRKSKVNETKEIKAIEMPRTVRESVIQPSYSSGSEFSMQDTKLFQSIITSGMLREEVSKTSQLSTAFLDAIGAFPHSINYNVKEMVDFVKVIDKKKSAIESKNRVLETLIKTMKVEPMGYLHLERLQFTPLGYERGELVYSLPMLPGEIVRLTHREWSRTENEYSKLVATESETASEETISEKSELTQSSNTQQQHSSAYNASVSTGYSGYGFNISASFGYSCNNSEASSKQFATKQAQDITKKASSRAKKDSKITFKVTTTYEFEDLSFREIKNELGRPVRYDFYRLMKKWRIDLYRYDVRMTYDIVIPEPSNYLLHKYILLKRIENQLLAPNPFNLAPSSIMRHNPNIENPNDYEVLERKYGITLEQPPKETISWSKEYETKLVQQHKGREFLEIVLPEGYEFKTWSARGEEKEELITYDNGFITFKKVGTLNPKEDHNSALLNAGAKYSNRYLWEYEYEWNSLSKENNSMSIIVSGTANLSETKFKEWQIQCYEKLADAAKTQYENKLTTLKEMREALINELNREDALVLRKIEKEELMKSVLRWLLGPNFEFYPQDELGLPTLAPYSLGDLEFYDPKTQSVKIEYWKPTLQFGEMIKFLHQAIEWESVNYVLYPYFWTDKNLWEFKQSLYHTDYVHRSFLRAGAARVVLTIRRGYEKDFLSYMEGSFNELLGSTHPYMTAVQELEAMAKTKYPYTQDANVEKEEYVFTWENIPRNVNDQVQKNDTERLLYYLEQDLFINWDYLFSLSLEFINELDTLNNQPVSSNLINEFKKHQTDQRVKDISNKLVEITQKGNKWTIKEGNTPQYDIRCENTGVLNVYDLVDTNRPKPSKSADGNVIYLTVGDVAIQITMDEKKGTALLRAGKSRTYDLLIKQEDGQHKVYKEQNWVDTWYEFTPTGALDVIEGNVLQ